MALGESNQASPLVSVGVVSVALGLECCARHVGMALGELNPDSYDQSVGMESVVQMSEYLAQSFGIDLGEFLALCAGVVSVALWSESSAHSAGRALRVLNQAAPAPSARKVAVV